jgi:MFS family permease
MAGLLADRIGPRLVMSGGLFVQAIGLTWTALTASAGTAYGSLVLPLVVAGIGISMAIPTTSTAAMSAVAPADMGKASGVINTLQRLGAAFAIALVSAVFSAGLGASSHLGSAAQVITGVRPALEVSAALSALGAVCALGVAARKRQAAQAPAETEPAYELTA